MNEWRTTTLLLDALAAGEDLAWRQFLERFRTPIVRLARARGLDSSESDDAAQQTLYVFWDGVRRGTFDRRKGRLSAWLFGIARLQVQRLNEKAAARRGRGLAGTGDDLPSAIGAVDDESIWEDAWRHAVLEAALARVKEEVEEKTWTMFERVQVNGERAEAVAAELGVTKNTVFLAKHRVLTRLRGLEKEIDDA